MDNPDDSLVYYRIVLLDSPKECRQVFSLFVKEVGIVYDVAFLREWGTLAGIMEVIFLYLFQIPFNIIAARKALIRFDAGFVSVIPNFVISRMIPQHFLGHDKLAIPFFELERIGVRGEVNPGVDAFRRFASLEKEFVDSAIQRYIFGKFLFVHPV